MNKKIPAHFKKHDPILYSYILKVGKIEPIKKEKPHNYFFRLTREIICQQLSGKAGDAIFSRFIKLFPNGLVQPLDVLSISHRKLRGCGMSNAKAYYIRNLTEAIIHGGLAIFYLDPMTDEEVIAELTKVKGIGRWTAEMFLMFVLGRENVFSHGDLGLKKGIMKVYGFKEKPSKEQIDEIIRKWSPYKTFASRVLWESLEIT
jgi:DNA-3-methyladenine glycosylase II